MGDFAIFGSGPLLIRGIIPAANDLDILCRGAAWEQAKSISTIEYREEYGVEIATMCGGKLSFGTKWGIGDFDIDALIESAEFIDALPFVRLEHVIAYKSLRASTKDIRHINALANSDYGISSSGTG